jgi:hypothetical protein
LGSVPGLKPLSLRNLRLLSVSAFNIGTITLTAAAQSTS